MADGDRERTTEYIDHWLWIIDNQYVQAPLGPDTLEQEDNKRKLESPALTRAVILNAEGKTASALKEVDSAVQSGEGTPEMLWAKGQLEFELGRYEESRKAYERVLAQRARDKGATFNIALCLQKLERFEESAEHFREVIRLDADLAAAKVGLGTCLLNLEQAEAALKEFSACLEKNAGHRQALTGKAAALHMLKQYDEAFEIYSRVQRAHPDDADVLANLVAISAARKDEPRLREFSERLLKMLPGARTALEGLITAALLRNDYDVAAHYGTQYLKAVPESYEGWFNQGIALQKTGQIHDAVHAYEQAIRIRPNGHEALANVAAILHDQDMERARQAYERVLETDPGHTSTLWNLGLLYQKSGNKEGAEKCYARLVKIKADREDAWLRLGYLRLERGDPAGAIKALERIATKPRARSDAQTNLAIAYWRSGRMDAAKGLLEKALSDRPDSSEFLRVLAAIAVEESDCEEARKLESKLAQLGESLPDLSYNVGVLLQSANRYDEAAEAFKRAAKAKPGFGEALLNLGHALKALGEDDKANECWREAVEAMPELAGTYFSSDR